MSNYPEDVRQYDTHPGSPFYVEPAVLIECASCEMESSVPESDSDCCPICQGNDVKPQ